MLKRRTQQHGSTDYVDQESTGQIPTNIFADESDIQPDGSTDYLDQIRTNTLENASDIQPAGQINSQSGASATVDEHVTPFTKSKFSRLTSSLSRQAKSVYNFIVPYRAQVRFIALFRQLLGSVVVNLVRYPVAILISLVAVFLPQSALTYLKDNHPSISMFVPKKPSKTDRFIQFFIGLLSPILHILLEGGDMLIRGKPQFPGLLTAGKHLIKAIGIIIAMPVVALGTLVIGEKVNPFNSIVYIKSFFNSQENRSDEIRQIKDEDDYSKDTRLGLFMAKHGWARNAEQEMVFIFSPLIKLFKSQTAYTHKSHASIVLNRQEQYTLIAGLRNIVGGLFYDESHYVKNGNKPRHSGLLFSVVKLAFAFILLPLAKFGLLSSSKLGDFAIDKCSWKDAAKECILYPLAGIARSIVTLVTGIFKIGAAALNTVGVLWQRNTGDASRTGPGHTEAGLANDEYYSDVIDTKRFSEYATTAETSTVHGWHPRTVCQDIKEVFTSRKSDGEPLLANDNNNHQRQDTGLGL